MLRHRLTASAGLGLLLLVVAGIYQISPLKQGCLRHCRNPLSYLLAHPEDGPFRLGLRHGAWCVACCWALMLLAFALEYLDNTISTPNSSDVSISPDALSST